MKKRMGFDLPVAALALLIALLLWFHVATEKEYIREVDIPFTVANEPQELVLLTTPPSTVRARIGGTGKELLKYSMARERRFCTLDISGARRGEVVYSLEEENFELPSDLDLVEVPDNLLAFRFERRAKRSVRVKANTVGSTREGYTVLKEIIEPERISLSGPENLLRNIDAVDTEPVDLGNRSKPFETVTRLVPPEGAGWQLTPGSVHIEFLVEKIFAATYDSVSVNLRNRPDTRPVSVSPRFIKLTLSGAESMMRELDVIRLVVEIDLENLRTGEYSLPARIKLPEGVSLISAVPKRFNVVIQ